MGQVDKVRRVTLYDGDPSAVNVTEGANTAHIDTGADTLPFRTARELELIGKNDELTQQVRILQQRCDCLTADLRRAMNERNRARYETRKARGQYLRERESARKAYIKRKRIDTASTVVLGVIGAFIGTGVLLVMSMLIG